MESECIPIGSKQLHQHEAIRASLAVVSDVLTDVGVL